MVGPRDGWIQGLAMVAVVASLALSACGGDDQITAPPPDNGNGDTDPPPKQVDLPKPGDGTGGVKLTEIGSFELPLYVTQPPEGGDLYVVEQTGRVQRVPADSGSPELFLDLSDQVSCCGEQGLLSIAFAPDYAESGLVYASFTNTEGDSRVVEYRSKDGGSVDAEAGREVLAIDQPATNHNGGLVLFGPDDQLYLGYGDGGGAGDPDRNGQDLGTLLGKLLRIDPQESGGEPYSTPKDTPYTGIDAEGSDPAAIYAIGLRNPWRFSFDRETGDLWIGDVGQDAIEEIDAVRPDEIAGANFGWSAYEGDARFNDDQEAPGHVPPVFTYPTAEGCSVTGGYVVRDEELESLYGRYLYGDYCEGELRSFTAEPGRTATDDKHLGVQVPGLSSFGEDVDGNLYATSLEGPVYRLDPAK